MNEFEKLFDIRNVYITWCEDFKDKLCFCANDVNTLKENVINNLLGGVVEYNDYVKPFKMHNEEFIFCYYDPNYGEKRNSLKNKKFSPIKYETFAKLINYYHIMNQEMDSFNKSIDKIFGSDTYSMYIKPFTIIENLIIEILQDEFGESKEGAEWFIYEGLEQIEKGGTEIGENGKIYKIKSIKDYYNYLVSLHI